MKRDMELVRRILLAMDAQPHGFATAPIVIPGYDQETVGHHVWLMADGGLITAAEMTVVGDPSPTSAPLAITWKGRAFLDGASWSVCPTHGDYAVKIRCPQCEWDEQQAAR